MEDWSFDEQLIAAGEEQAHRLRAAAARPGRPAGYDAALAALVDDLDVPAAIAVAEDAGGAAAGLVIDVVGLHHREPVRRSPILPYS